MDQRTDRVDQELRRMNVSEDQAGGMSSDKSSQWASTNRSQDAAEIERKIERTRTRLSRTIDSIQERLSISEMTDQLFDRVTDGAKTGGQQAWRMVQKNPLPAALIGAGIVWMCIPRSKASVVEHRGYDAYGEKQPGMFTRLKESARHAKENVSGKAHHMMNGFRHRSNGHGSFRSDVPGTFGSPAGGGYNDVAYSESYAVRSGINQQPLLVGAGAFILGMAAGALIPGSETERRTMSKASGAFLDRAKEAGREAVEEVQDTARRAIGKVKEEITQKTSDTRSGPSAAESPSFSGGSADYGTPDVRSTESSLSSGVERNDGMPSTAGGPKTFGGGSNRGGMM